MKLHRPTIRMLLICLMFVWIHPSRPQADDTITNEGWLTVEHPDPRGHDVYDAITGAKVGTISTLKSSIRLPAGLYNMDIGEANWTNIQIEQAKETVLEPGWLVIEYPALHGLTVYDVETDSSVGTIDSLAQAMILPPGRYSFLYGKQHWTLDIEPGKVTTLAPGLIDLENAAYVGNNVYTKAGELVKRPNLGNPWFTLKPGDYTVILNDKSIPFSIRLGEPIIYNEDLIIEPDYSNQ